MQKRILLAVFTVTVATAVNAQIKKGALLLGGQLSFSSQKNESTASGQTGSASNYFNISPAFGKAIKENLLIGADIAFSHGKNELSAVQEQVSNTYGAGFFIRKYKELGKGFYLFGQARVGGGHGQQVYADLTSPNNAATVKSLYLQLALYPGVSYTLSRKLQVEAGFNNLALIGYQHTKQTSPNTAADFSSNHLTASSSLSSFAGPTIGFQVLLN